MAKFNSDGGGGTGAAAAAPAAAPASAPSPSPAPAPAAAPSASAPAPAGGVTPPADSQQGSQGASPNPSPAAAAPAGKLIDTLPTRNSPEYWSKWSELSHEQQIQVESEWAARDSGQDAPPSEKPKETDPMAAPLPGDKPAGEKEVFITEETMNKLGKAPLSPEEGAQIQAVLTTMQARIDEFAPVMGEEFGKGMQMFMEDPIIKQRMDEISSGKVWEPGELAKEFKPETYLSEQAVQALDFIGDPEGSKTKLAGMLQQAHADGLRVGQQKAEYSNQQKVAFAERKATFEKGFNDLVSAHPELKPKDPSVTDIRDPNHPLRPVLKWAAENLGDRFFVNPQSKNPFKAAYAAFLADGGRLDDAIATTVKNSHLKFIRNLTEAQKTAATVGRETPSSAPARTSPVPNLDVDRYINDPVYARSFYENADHATRLKLEEVRYGSQKSA